MLSAQNRLRDPELFRKVFRFGERAGNRKLVVHVLTGEVSQNERLVGFVVPKNCLLYTSDAADDLLTV